MIKKLISLLLLIALITAPVFPVQAAQAAQEEPAGTAALAEEPEVGLLTELHIFDDETKTQIITNQGYILHILKLLHEEPIPLGNAASIFPDVKTNIAEMNRAYMLGLATGKNGCLRPDEAITLQEAVVMLVKALGYKISAEQQGGYPAGYIQAAGSLHLLDGVPDADMDAPLTYPQAAALFQNALTAPIMHSKYTGDAVEYVWEKDVTILSQYHHVFKKTGVIQANRYANISDAEYSLSAGEVVIGDERFLVGDTNASKMVGYKVLSYYQFDEEQDTATLLYLEDRSGRVLTVDAADLEPQNQINSIAYADKNGKTKTIRFPEDMVIIFNGKRCFDLTVQDLQPQSGSMTFIDNDADGRYEVMHLVSYAVCVVKSVVDQTKILDYYQKTQLDLEDLEYYTLTSGGEPIESASLGTWDVLSVARSKDGKIADILVSTQKITGQVTGLYEDGVEIDGQEYDYLPVYAEYRKENPQNAEQARDMVQVYLDAGGRVAAIDLSWNIGRTGLLVKAVIPEEAEDDVLFTIFDRENGAVKYKAAKKVKIDGISYKSSQVMGAVGNMKRYYDVVPILYDLNAKDEVTAIDTPEIGPNERESLRPLCENETITYVREAHSFSARFFFGGSTMLTYIPEDAKNLDKYVVRSLDMVRGDMSKAMSAFAVGDSVIADIILIQEEGGQATVSNTEIFALVERIDMAINADDEPINILYAYKNGETLEVKTEDLEVLEGVEPGDVLFFELTAKNELKDCAEIYKKGVLGEFDTSLSGTGRLAGQVYAKEESIIGLSFSEDMHNPGTIQYVNLFNRPPVYIYDSKTKTVEIGSVEDILDYQSAGSNCSKVFVQTRFSVVKGVVIYQ